MFKFKFISFEKLRKHLSNQMRKNRDKKVRELVELFYLAAKLQNVSEACARRGVSRDYFYRWWKRLQEGGVQIEALRPKSKKPKNSPRRISLNHEIRIRYLRKVTGEGAQMLNYRLEREGIKLSKSTVRYVLNRRRRGKKPKKPKLKVHQKRYELPIPGQRVQIDVKHAGTLLTGQKIYVFNAIDECTRWKYAKAYLNYWAETTVEFLNDLQKHFPFPIQCLQSDNGAEFTNRLTVKFVGGEPRQLHPVEKWCRIRNIRHRLIPPGEKELNGKVERSHRMDDEYCYYRASRTTLDNFNKSLGHWMGNYLFRRPHGGLRGLTPFEKWQERLKNLPREHVEERWVLAQARFLRDFPLHRHPEQQLWAELEREILLYNDSIGRVISVQPLKKNRL
jgi:transposase InsO family protein